MVFEDISLFDMGYTFRYSIYITVGTTVGINVAPEPLEVLEFSELGVRESFNAGHLT